MVRLLSSIWLLLVAFAPLDAQNGDLLLSTRLDAVYAQLKSNVASAPEVSKLEMLVKSQYWLTAVDGFASLGSLNIDEPVDKLNSEELSLLEELETNVRVFLKSDNTHTEVRDKAQAFIAKLPLTKNQFVIKTISPILHIAGSNSDKQIVISGSFPLLLKDSTANYLKLRDRKVPYSSVTDSTITFNFNLNDLGIYQINFRPETDIELHLVGQVGKKINPKKQFRAVYHLLEMQVPQSPGKIIVMLGDSQSNVEKQTKKTRTFLLNGSKGNLLEKQCVPTHDGWSLVPESVELVVESSAGKKDRDWSYRKTTTGGKVCFTTEVFYNSTGTSGKLEYHLKYDVQRTKSESTTAQKETALAWGMSKQLQFDLAILSVSYVDYNGNTFKMDGNELDLPGVILKLSENTLLISTPALSTNEILP